MRWCWPSCSWEPTAGLDWKDHGYNRDWVCPLRCLIRLWETSRAISPFSSVPLECGGSEKPALPGSHSLQACFSSCEAPTRPQQDRNSEAQSLCFGEIRASVRSPLDWGKEWVDWVITISALFSLHGPLSPFPATQDGFTSKAILPSEIIFRSLL